MSRNFNRSISLNVEDQTARRERPRIFSTRSIVNTLRSNARLEQRNSGVPMSVIPFNSQSLLEAIDQNDPARCESLIMNHDSWADKFDGHNVHPFLISAERGLYEIMEVLLRFMGTLNINMLGDNRSCTALHLALRCNSMDCCKLLLDHHIKADIGDKTKSGDTALHLAAKGGHLEVITRIVKENPEISIDIRNKLSRTCLHVAAAEGQDEIVKFLLSRGADRQAKDKCLHIPLHLAALNGYHSCCVILLNGGEDTIRNQLDALLRDKSTPLILAAKKGNAICCTILSDSEINKQDLQGNTALHYAASNGYTSTVETLLGLGAKVVIKNNDGKTSIHMASCQKELIIFKRLIESSEILLDLSEHNQSVLHYAALRKSTDILEYLLQKEIYLEIINARDKDGRTALHLAVKRGGIKAAKLLIDNKANIYINDNERNTALHLAAHSGLRDICQLLVLGEKKKIINEPNNDGFTPLHLAAKKGFTECCNIFVNKGAKIEITDRDGNMALHLAAREGHSETLKKLIKKGAQVSMTVEKTGNTALHLAALHGHKSCCELLFNNSAKVYKKKNKAERMALDEAFYAKYDEVFQYLLINHTHPRAEEQFQPIHDQSLHSNIHNYMHIALIEQRGIIQRAIVESRWWFAGFHSSSCIYTPCQNLKQLIRTDPNLAFEVFDKCVSQVSQQNQNGKHIEDVYYNFRLIETSFHIPKGLYTLMRNEFKTEQCKKLNNNTYLPIPSTQPKTNKAISSRTMPFDPKTGKLIDDAKELTKDYDWSSDHVLRTAADCECLGLLQHPLTTAYLKHNWDSYVWKICLVYIILEITGTLSIAFYLGVSWNWNQITSNFNLTRDEFYELPESPILASWNTRLASYILVSVLWIIFLIVEINNILKARMKYVFFLPNVTLGILRSITLMVLLLPLNVYKTNDVGIVETLQWQVGILAFIISWFLMIHTLNKYPPISVFMPITTAFAKSFMKVLCYIILILMLFSYTFHLLLQSKKAFRTIPQSLVKTLVWLLGDLGYDDTFLEDGEPLPYPIMTNVIFVLLITSITGFIFNLIISNPSEKLNFFRDKATLFKEKNSIMLYLKIGSLFPSMRRKNTLGFKLAKVKISTDVGSNPSDSNKGATMHSKDEAKEGDNLDDKTDKGIDQKEILDQIKSLSEQISMLEEQIKSLQ